MNSEEYLAFLKDYAKQYEAMRCEVLLWAKIMKPHYLQEIVRLYKMDRATVRTCYITARKSHPYPIRPTLSVKLQVLERDNYVCQYCGYKGKRLDSGFEMVVDHVVSTFYDGPGMHWNLVSCCGRCNVSKGPNTWIPNNIKVLQKLNKDWAKKIKKEGERRIVDRMRISNPW